MVSTWPFILKEQYRKIMNYEILKNPMGIIYVSMNKGEKVTAEAGSMVFIKGDIETVTSMRKGGFSKHSRQLL